MRNKGTLSNIDNSNLTDYPKGRIKNDTGGGDGTPVNEEVYGDLHETKDKLLRLYGIEHNNLPDNESNGYQLVDALVALASKNDFIVTATSSGNSLQIPVKLNFMKENESIIIKASTDKTVETQITGTLNGVSKTISLIGGDWKAGEYLRLINTSGSVVLVRLLDFSNVENFIEASGFLKKATQTEENAGTSDNRGTTPVTNKTAFTKRVVGSDSSSYIASITSNGLLSKEDKFKIDNFADPSNIIKTTYDVVTVNAWQSGNNSNNFNFNYYDISPPVGKSMSSFKGLICSKAESRVDTEGRRNEYTWCKYQVRPNNIRIICGSNRSKQPSKVQYLAIWI